MPERRLEEARWRGQLDAAIAACAQRFAEHRDLHETVQSSVNIIRDHIGFDRVGIYLYDELHQDFVAASGTDTAGCVRDERGKPLDRDPRNPAWRALAGEGDEFFTEDFEQMVPDDAFMRGVKNHFFIVLRSESRILGAISVDNLLTQRPISEASREALRRFARYIALAVENLELRERVLEKNRALTRELDERNRLLEQLDRVNAELKDFALTIAHDLKAPLRGISSLAQWLAEDYAGRLDEAGREKLALMVERTRRMHELIEGVLRYAEAGASTAGRTEVDVEHLLRGVLGGLTIPEAVSVSLQTPLPPVVYNPIQLEQVFQNLVGNAVVHMGRPSGHIRIFSEEDVGEVTFHVADDGTGLAEKDFERVFKMFQVAHKKEARPSSGVGLAIVKKIVELNGGRVSVRAGEGAGATFSFSVPRRTPSV